MLLTSFLLLALTSLIVWVSNHSLMSQFQQSRDEFYESQSQEVKFNVQRSADVMRQMAGMVASSEDLGYALLNNNEPDAELAIKALWPTLQLDVGLDDIVVYNRELRPIVTFGHKLEFLGGAGSDDWLGDVLDNERPRDKLLCTESCKQYVAVPVLAGGVDAGVVMISRSLADITRYLQKSSGSEVALLVGSDKPSLEGRYLPSWGISLAALTHESTVFPFIQELSRKFSFSETQGKALSYIYDGKKYEISSIALGAGSNDRRPSYFLLISNVTDQLNGILKTTQTILTISLVGWAAAEILLYLILRYRMGRLREISRKLPLLAERKYNVMRHSIKARRSLFVDEIDALETTAVELEIKLEGLEAEVGKRGLQLEAKIKDLARERDFIRGLMNTAQVLVLTHRRDGFITLTNRLCQTMTGLSDQALLHCSFQQLFSMDFFNVDEFFNAGGQQESHFVSVDGTVRTIVWYHTPLRIDEERRELISVGVDITERKLAENRLAWLANRDSLTELYNRRFFEEALNRAVVAGAFGAVLYLDLDRFKDVNELSGHQTGDQLLRAVASTLSGLSHGYIVARLGGDEFAVLMEHTSTDAAVDLARKIADHLDQQSIHIHGRTHRASASIGIAAYPDHGDRPDKLMANADYAMYRAKEDMAKRWHLLQPDQQDREELKQRVYWAERIRSALLYDQFELMLQPIFRLTDFNIQHYEALLRLRGDDGEYLSPGAFIPIAERNGQIAAIDRWVVAKGIELISRFVDNSISLAINLSGQSLQDKELMPLMESEFEKWEVEPRRLIVEVTETAAVTDFTSARGVLEDIRRLGCQVALDDFGVGFSSFYYLGQLPSDYIKVDGSFITTLPDSEENQLIVKAIADIAKGLGKKTVAEFVDKPSILPYLRKYNIDYVQGFYLGRPQPATEVGIK
ncbi:bifunctional diguanylate cyclase/phosphodiesterase [Salinicola halimionae]|uniref:bifunctional diguanylate cyclase/phosphodiesterase n=1 Tax=Salinicola halimionae TaxID=1949081 RepID=UPI00165F9333|nr:EAL domain-containing protein [Salinicola halimionae]